jgi:DNA helicase-2/ATP-dependent DNA helicase PcrA
VKEIPSELLDNKLPSVKRWDEDDYDNDSYEKSLFRSKPFGATDYSSGAANSWAAAASYLEDYNRAKKPVSAKTAVKLSDTVFDKPAPKAAIGGVRPKAVVRKKETPSANKPYIAKSLDGLTKGVPTLSANDLGYVTGDRVSHVKYGEGTVLNIVQEPKDFKVTVNFDAYGNKIMYAAFAKLKKI